MPKNCFEVGQRYCEIAILFWRRIEFYFIYSLWLVKWSKFVETSKKTWKTNNEREEINHHHWLRYQLIQPTLMRPKRFRLWFLFDKYSSLANARDEFLSKASSFWSLYRDDSVENLINFGMMPVSKIWCVYLSEIKLWCTKNPENSFHSFWMSFYMHERVNINEIAWDFKCHLIEQKVIITLKIDFYAIGIFSLLDNRFDRVWLLKCVNKITKKRFSSQKLITNDVQRQWILKQRNETSLKTSTSLQVIVISQNCFDEAGPRVFAGTHLKLSNLCFPNELNGRKRRRVE